MRRFVFFFSLCWVHSLLGGDAITGVLHPEVSPDGKQIAVSYQGVIGVVDVQSRVLRRTTKSEGWDIEPAWSPDGNRIAFQRSPNHHSGPIFWIDVDTEQVSHTPKAIRAQGRMFFSGDGKRILSLVTDGSSPIGPGWVELETAKVTLLGIGPEDPVRFGRKRIQIALSENGEYVYYAIHRDEPNEQGGNRGPQSDVWRCRADGSQKKLLFAWPARIHGIATDPDGESLVVVTDLGVSHNDLWRVPLENPLNKAERLTANFADDERPSFDSRGNLWWSDNFRGPTELHFSGENAAGTLPIKSVDFGEKTGHLVLSLNDESVEGAVTARLSIKRIGGNFYFPNDKLYRLTGEVGHFYATGETKIELPVGEYEVKAYRGLEYEVSKQPVTIAAGETEETIKLKRWSHLAKSNWYSGENHVHANYGYGEWYNKPESILLQASGEDLNVCNTVIANSDGDAIYDREFFLGQLDPRSTDDHLVYFGQEFRSTFWGHMTLSNLSQLVEPIMTGFPGTTNPYDYPTNGDISQRVIDQQGTVGYTHPAGNPLDLYDQPYSAKGLPIDAANGTNALMDIHGHTYEGASQLWYKLLNCNLRVIGSAGTDVFLNRLRSYPPGWARTYVHLPDGLTYEGWTEGQRAGRSFFTNGPMLEFSVNGQEIGSSMELDGPGKVTVTARVDSSTPIDRFEIVQNGRLIKSVDVEEGGITADFNGEIEISESGWVALRVHGPAHPEIIREPNAHTNPIWISIEGKPNSQTPRDAVYFLKWIDRLEADLKERDRIPTERLWGNVKEQLKGARKYYQELL